MRRFAVVFLAVEAVATASWWVGLTASPEFRAVFVVPGAPDATLFAFAPGDLILFAGSAAVAAVGLTRRSEWAWPILCVHAGAAMYAGLYCWTAYALAGGQLLAAAVSMTPPLIVPAVLACRLRPRRG